MLNARLAGVKMRRVAASPRRNEMMVIGSTKSLKA